VVNNIYEQCHYQKIFKYNLGINGDALSPLLPARHDFHKRRTIEEVGIFTWAFPSSLMANLEINPQVMATNKLPRIPAMPLGFVEARQILSRMDGREVPAEWRGGLNIKYRIGPGFQKADAEDEIARRRKRLHVRTIHEL
jgi:hypothetical protein